MYQLVFKGERVPGVDENTARGNAMALFKATIAQVDRMFSGQAVVIRNKLDEETATKYQAVLRKHGMICYIEPMAGVEAPTPAAAPAETPPPASRPEPAVPAASAPASEGTVEVEPGDRLPVAGEKVDDILSHSSLKLDPVGVRMEAPADVEAPVFEHLDDWSLAPAGSDLGEQRDAPPPIVPDVSHLSLADEEKKSG
ncbi:hypothetical protein [Mangrovitalea sediminis]|uniref:hypothetical protein n=1 Tax=Mangrovitalea sediminis TaxID=1982043 RepID=UPI000BE5DD46|nr:hypothetical protein [Mangrovitalea sediminis]